MLSMQYSKLDNRQNVGHMPAVFIKPNVNWVRACAVYHRHKSTFHCTKVFRYTEHTRAMWHFFSFLFCFVLFCKSFDPLEVCLYPKCLWYDEFGIRSLLNKWYDCVDVLHCVYVGVFLCDFPEWHILLVRFKVADVWNFCNILIKKISNVGACF